MEFGKPIKQLDRTKPRFRDTEFKQNLISEKLYKEFKKTHKDSTLKEIQFNKLINKILIKYTDKTIENTDGVELPFYLGQIKINYISYLETADAKKSGEVGKLVRSFNWDTGQRVGKIVWKRKYALRFNKDLKTVAFNGCRNFTQKVKNSILNNAGHYKDLGK